MSPEASHTLTRRIAVAAFCLIAAAGLATYALMQSPQRVAQVTGTADVGGAFSMVSHTGAAVTDKAFLGRPTLLFFGFTFCPDVCPTELQVITAALDQLGEKGKDIQPLFVSIDPARDTPQVMADYVGNFGPRWTGLTGTAEQVAGIARAYKVYFARQENTSSPADYLMDHSSIIYLMGADGRFLRHFSYTTDAKSLADGIAQALQR
jgi:cytochrome oxidase Cu insertion factor (SCO1/SenC/PrrC family)